MVYYLIIGAYIILYIGMILHDLLRVDPNEVQPKQEEEEIDITQEAEAFKPVEVVKEAPEAHKPAVPVADNEKKAKEEETPRKTDSTKHQSVKDDAHTKGETPVEKDTSKTETPVATDRNKPEPQKDADSCNGGTVTEHKPVVTDNHQKETTDEKPSTQKPQPVQQPLPQPQQSEPNSTEDKSEEQDTAEKPVADSKPEEEDIPVNETEYSGQREFEELEKEITACSQEDPEMREAAYEIMRIDSGQF